MDNVNRIAYSSSARIVSLCILFYIAVVVFFAMGCRLASHLLSTKNDSDIAIEAPATQDPIFRDDFNGQLDPAWTWQNEDASLYKLNEDGWLEITGGDQSLLAGGQQINLLWTQLPEGDFVISIHLKTQPLFDFQRAGILLYEDSGRYISLSRGYCMECVLGGNGVFLEYNLEGERMRYAVAAEAADLYLMLIRAQGFVGAFYALETGQWQNVGNVETDVPFERIALDVTNNSKWENGYDVVGTLDYFEIHPSFHRESAPPWILY